MASVPMLVRRRVVGVLNVHSRTARNYGDGDLVLLTQVANLMARAIENARLYGRLAEREEMLERFATRTIEAQELERRRLAGEIHDGISQRLVSLWYHLLAAEDGVGDPETVRRELGTAKELATAALGEARAAITGLRPFILDDLGLGPGLESLGGRLADLEVEVEVEAVELAPHVEVALYRIAQEALQNVVKHAQATTVVLRLTAGPDGVRLVIADNGRGFDEEELQDGEERHSYGLVGMRERAELIGASLVLVSRPATGTTVEVLVPASGGAGRRNLSEDGAKA